MSLRRRLSTCMITADVDETSLVLQVRRALAAGVDFVQLRRRNRPVREVEALATRLVALSPLARERVLVNDRLDVALSSGAAGVHLPADGLPVADVKRVVPERFVVSRSTHTRCCPSSTGCHGRSGTACSRAACTRARSIRR